MQALENLRATVPWDDVQLAQLYQLLRAGGYDPERIARAVPRQIVHTYYWRRDAVAVNSAKDETTTHRISHSDPSIIMSIGASVTNAWFAQKSADPTAPNPSTWSRGNDPAAFSRAPDPLDYIKAQVKPTPSTQVATDFVPLSHLVRQNPRSWMPTVLDFVPGANFSAYEMLLRAPKSIWFEELTVTLTAVQLIGL